MIINEFSKLSGRIIGCAIEVHKYLGPGLLESVYQKCLAYEFEINNITFKKEFSFPLEYKGIELDCGYKLDFFIDNKIILELKSVDKILGIHEAQLLTYMKLLKVKKGLLINFNEELLKNGIKSFVL